MPDKAKKTKSKNRDTRAIKPIELTNKVYARELRRLQVELVKLQEWVRKEGVRIAVLFEGRDGAGKGGTIKRIAARTNPRVVRIEALGKPTERERTEWYFQRYVARLPAAGEIVLFDRSWYNRAGVERVMGFCTDQEYWEFLREAPAFEQMLMRSGIHIIKYWFSVSAEEQESRFQARMQDLTKHWKLSPMDLAARDKWNEYASAKDIMFEHTDTDETPWWVVPSDDKKKRAVELHFAPTQPVPLCGRKPETNAIEKTSKAE